MKSKVSIIMGVYNGEKYIEESIESILSQTYVNWELIICDDFSNDNTISILKSYAKKDSRIKIIRHSENKGLAEALNTCLKKATGEYIARQDDDDISLSDRLSKQVEFLQNNSEYDIVGTNAYTINHNGDIWGEWIQKRIPSKMDLVKGVCFIHPSIMIKRDVLLSLGGYNSKAIRVEDYDLWFRLFEKGYRGFNIDEKLVKYRLDLESYGKRKYKYRVNEFKIRIYGYRKNNIPKHLYIYAFKPLIVGLIPGSVMALFHKYKMK